MNYRLVRQLLLCLTRALLVSVVVVGQQPASTTPQVDRLREVVTYLASDALEGRRTGTAGANDAARYIAGEFQRFGLKPGFPSNKPVRLRAEQLAQYQQKFPYAAGVELGKNNSLSLKTPSGGDAGIIPVGQEWMPLGFSSNTSINARVVFAGYGISAAELKYDDYAASAVKDMVAVVFAGTPDGDNPYGQFARTGEIRFKVAAARAAGARALLIIA